MNRKILTLLFISFISVCLVIGMFGRIAMAASNDEDVRRGADAWERYTQYVGGMEQTVVRQYTSPYDLARGEIYPEMTFTYSAPNYARMLNPFSPTYESSYEASGTGGYFTGPIMRFPVSGLSYMMGTLGSPQVQMYQSAGPFTGSQSYSSIYPGLGLGTAGFMLGPFAYSGGGGYYSGAAAYGSYGGGYPGYAGYGGGYGYGSPYPTMIF